MNSHINDDDAQSLIDSLRRYQNTGVVDFSAEALNVALHVVSSPTLGDPIGFTDEFGASIVAMNHTSKTSTMSSLDFLSGVVWSKQGVRIRHGIQEVHLTPAQLMNLKELVRAMQFSRRTSRKKRPLSAQQTSMLAKLFSEYGISLDEFEVDLADIDGVEQAIVVLLESALSRIVKPESFLSLLGDLLGMSVSIESAEVLDKNLVRNQLERKTIVR